jgi:hypothetical protein
MLGRRGTLITSTVQPPVGLACRSRWRWRKSGEGAGSALAVLKFSSVSVVAESYNKGKEHATDGDGYVGTDDGRTDRARSGSINGIGSFVRLSFILFLPFPSIVGHSHFILV